MTARLVSLDDIAGLESAWHELRRAHEIKTADPELRRNIERAVTIALNDGRLTEDQATEISAELETTTPPVVLEAHWRELIPNRPTLGAFPRHEIGPAPDLGEWYRADPERLRRLVAEMGRFSTDLSKIAAVALDAADKFGIPEDVADRIISDALHALNSEQRQVTTNAK
jgi:hypothetical protein